MEFLLFCNSASGPSNLKIKICVFLSFIYHLIHIKSYIVARGKEGYGGTSLFNSLPLGR